jgi:hypothetical protein
MDMITLFEFLSAYLLFTTGNNKRYLLYAGLAGVLLACGMLTNPRIIFTFPFFVCAFVYDLYKLETCTAARRFLGERHKAQPDFAVVCL